MGDPETEVVLPRITSDLAVALKATAQQKLAEVTIELDPRTAATVMLVSGGYPEAYEKGKAITGLERVTDSIVFHAGTKNEHQTLQTNGGRVLALTSFGKDHHEALNKSYTSAKLIDFDGVYYRTDLGFDL